MYRLEYNVNGRRVVDSLVYRTKRVAERDAAMTADRYPAQAPVKVVPVSRPGGPGVSRPGPRP